MATPADVIHYAQPNYNLPFRDRRTGLMVFGIVFIILGALSGCFGSVAIVGLIFILIAPLTGMANTSMTGFGAMMISGALLYALTATGLIWTGIASTRNHRWVRPVILVCSWVTIGGTVLGTVNYLLSLPSQSAMYNTTIAPGGGGAAGGAGGTVQADGTVVWQATQPAPGRLSFTTIPGPGQPTWITVLMAAISVVIMLALGVGLPALLVWFYGSQDTRMTLEHFDPRTRWTDGIPLPVFGVSLISGLGTLVLLTMVLQFGASLFLLRSPTIGAMLALTILLIPLLLATAKLSYRIQTMGWMLAMAAVVVGGAGWLAILLWGDPVAQMRVFMDQFMAPEVMEAFAQAQRKIQLLSTSVWMLGALGYLFWARRFFISPAQSPGAV